MLIGIALSQIEGHDLVIHCFQDRGPGMKLVELRRPETGFAGLLLRTLCMAVLGLVLASCGGARLDDLFSESAPRQPTVNPQPVQPVPGTGAKVALLLPLNARGQTANIGKAMKQAAELAMFDAGGSGIT